MIVKAVVGGVGSVAMLLGLAVNAALSGSQSDALGTGATVQAAGMLTGQVGACDPAGPGPDAAAAAARAAGFRGDNLVVAVAVAGAESGWRPDATNHNSNGSDDYGLWQINSVHAALLHGKDWADPVVNARMARVLFVANHGWSPWVAYTSGAYLTRMAEARQAVGGGGVTVVCAGDRFTDPALGSWPRPNPRTPDEAVAWARAQTAGPGVWAGRCMAFVAQAYGWSHSNWTLFGTVYAIDNYRQLPAQYKHPGNRDPPRGALVFWTTGNPAGHVALYLGGGMIASTDISRPGYVDVVPFSTVETRWDATYIGWSVPYFPHAA